MNRLFLVLFISLCISRLHAQKTDTLFYGDKPVIHPNPYGWGYIAGTNHYKDIGKYQRFDMIDEADIVGAKVYLGLKRIVGTADTIAIVFKNTETGKNNFDSSAGGPGKTIRTIKTTTAAFDTTKKGTVFMLSSPYRVHGLGFVPESVFVGLEWSTTMDDTFAIFCDENGQGELADRAWEQLTGASYLFQRFNEKGDFTWSLDTDIWIALLYKISTTSVPAAGGNIPASNRLEQNYPNPFNPSTSIRFTLSQSQHIRVEIFDLLGKPAATLIDENLSAGEHAVQFSAKGLPSGLYVYRLTGDYFTIGKTMTLLR